MKKISIKLSFIGNYVVRIIENDYITEKYTFSNENAIKFCKKLLNSKEYEMHEYSLLREEILN